MYSSRIIRYKDSKFPYLLNGIMNGLTIDLDFFSVSAYVLLGILSRVGGTSETKNGKNYTSLYSTISRRRKVVSGRTKKRFKGEDFALPTIVRSSIESGSFRSFDGLKCLLFFFLILTSFDRLLYRIWLEESVVINLRTAMAVNIFCVFRVKYAWHEPD